MSARDPGPPSASPAALPPLDYRTAFEQAPIGLMLSRERLVTDANALALAIFGADRAQLVGRSFEQLYPSTGEFERTGERIAVQLDARG